MAGMSCVTSSRLHARILRYYAMNGITSAGVLPASAKAVRVTVSDDTLTVDLEDGRTIAVPIGWFPRLAYGTPEERAHVEIVGAGYGLHWPELDEDIGVEGLLLGKKSTESTQSFARWLAQRAQDHGTPAP